MRYAIVNAGLPGPLSSGGNAVTPPARADDLRVLGRCLVVIMLATGVLAFNAGELWPHLFAH
jgi:hypothetical protein